MTVAMHNARKRTVRPYHRDDPYRAQNSLVGMREAVAGNFDWMDIDANESRDEYWEGVHWKQLKLERQRYTRASWRAGVPFYKVGRLVGVRCDQLDHKVIATLRSRDGYRIRGLGALLILAAQRNLNVEVEPKWTPSAAQFRGLAVLAQRAYGDDWRRHVVIKRLATIPGWEQTLANAKAAGFTTCVLRHGQYVPHYVDQYRP